MAAALRAIRNLVGSIAVDVPGLENSTCENIAIYLWNALRPRIAVLDAVTVWETYDSKCTYRGA